MTINETVYMVCLEVRNFFSDGNVKVEKPKPPPDFVTLCKEIMAYMKKNAPTGLTGERFGEYGYTRSVGSDGAPVSWQRVFADRLKPYRKMFVG